MNSNIIEFYLFNSKNKYFFALENKSSNYDCGSPFRFHKKYTTKVLKSIHYKIGFDEPPLTYCCKHGLLDGFKFFTHHSSTHQQSLYQPFPQSNYILYKCLVLSAQHNHLNSIEWIYHKYDISPIIKKLTFVEACISGHLKLTKHIAVDLHSIERTDLLMYTCQFNHLDCIEWIIDTYNPTIHLYAIINICVKQKHMKLATWFFEKYRYLKFKIQDFPLHFINNDCNKLWYLNRFNLEESFDLTIFLELCLQKLSSVPFRYEFPIETKEQKCILIQLAYATGNLPFLKKEILNDDCKTWAPNGFIACSRHGHLKILKWLLILKNDGWGPFDIEEAFEIAVEHNQTKVILWLTKNYKLQDIINTRSITHVCKNGNLKILKLFIEETNGWRNNIIIHEMFESSCTNGHLELAQYIYENFKDSFVGKRTNFAHNCDCHYPIGYSCENGHVKVVDWILQTLPRFNQFYVPLELLCAEGRLDMIQCLKKNNCFTNIPGYIIEESIRKTCRCGHYKLLLWLIDEFKIVDPSIIREDNNYCLRKSCKHGHFRIVKFLVKQFNLTIDDVRSEDNDAFIKSCKYGHLEIAQWLHKTFNLTRDDATISENYALIKSCTEGHLRVAIWLTDAFRLTTEDARTNDCMALWLSCYQGYLCMVRWLLETFEYTKEDIEKVASNKRISEDIITYLKFKLNTLKKK